MTREEQERQLRAARRRAAQKRRRRKVMVNRILAAVFLIALICIIIALIMLLNNYLEKKEEEETNIPYSSAITDTPTPTPEEPSPTPGPTSTPTPTPVPDGVKRVAFTFDDGPDYTGLTYKFAQKLASYGGKATWFIVGNRLSNAEAADDLKKISEMGMEIGIHAWTHDYYFDQNPDKLDPELEKTEEAIYKLTGISPTLFRPPGGYNFTDKQVSDIKYPTILWSVDTEDWKLKKNATEDDRANNVQKIVDNIINNARDGSIILMHEIYSNSYDAFCIAIDRLAKEGYVFVTVSELIGDELRPGHKYTSGINR